ncbi:MAG: TonB-dependent receptor, partial [Helicobacteraceae bacterium]|jgi:outer membrane receptor for ferrienterochelin and colicins|nr:TonB-dependent receptor [Helicobacteraceae bacterium]
MRDKITTVAVLIGLLGGGATLYADESDETESQTSSVTGGATSTSSEESEAVSSETANADKKSASSAAEKLDDIVVTATGYEHNVADAPASVFVITREELEKKSYNDLTDALKNVPGIFVTGGNISRDVLIRGMSAEYTVFLIDGRPMSGVEEAHDHNGQKGGIAVNSLPPISMIERIEIVKVPASFLYGGEALGGVINIITKKVPTKWSGSAKGEYTKTLSDITQDSYIGSLNIAGPVIDNLLSLQAYGSASVMDEQHCPYLDSTASRPCGQRASSPSPHFETRQTGAKAIVLINEANSVWAAYDYAKQWGTEEGNVSTPSGNRMGRDALRYTASAGYDLKLDDLTINTYIQNSVSKNLAISRSGVANSKKGITHETLTLNTQGNYFFDTNILSAGAQYVKETLEDNAMNPTGNLIRRWSYALFAEDEWNVLDNLSLTGGVRWTEDEGFGTHFDPRAYIVYSPIDDLVIKGGISSAYKRVRLNRYSDDYNSVSSGLTATLTRGNPDLKPETSLNYEASVAYKNKEIGLGASVTAYRSSFKDRISSATICNSVGGCVYKGVTYDQIVTYENVNKAIVQGIETSLNYKAPEIFSLNAAYTYTDSEQKSGDNKGRALNAIAKHMFNVGADFEITKKFSLWTQYGYVGKSLETTATSSSTNRSYAIVDAGTVIRLTDGMKLLAGVYNVANKEITVLTHGKFIDGRRLTSRSYLRLLKAIASAFQNSQGLGRLTL